MAHKRIMGTCPGNINELLELNNSCSIAEIHEVLILPFHIGDTLERKREASTFFCNNFKMLESLPPKTTFLRMLYCVRR